LQQQQHPAAAAAVGQVPLGQVVMNVQLLLLWLGLLGQQQQE
jgi:hypothetical protein